MIKGDFGIDCKNCWCLTCIKNDSGYCNNCEKCSGNIGYDNWMMECEKYKECKNPEETIKIILGDIIE